MGSQENRLHARIPIRMEAFISQSGLHEHACTIYDYCPAGMFVVPEKMSVPMQAGQNVTLRFPVNGLEYFYVDGRIIRNTGEGLGVACVDIAPDVLQYLHGQSQEIEIPETSKVASAEGTHLRGELEKRFSRGIAKLLEGFFLRAKSDLESSEELAVRNWQAMLNAVHQLENKKSWLIEQMQQRLLGELDSGISIAHPESTQPSNMSDLSLLDDTAFMDWLAVTGLSSKLDSSLKELLFELRNRISQVLGYVVTRENNPIGPWAICHHFSELFNSLLFESSADTIVFKSFERELAENLEVIYQQLNQWLLDSGINPEIDQSFKVIASDSGSIARTIENEPDMAPEEKAQAATAGAAVDETSSAHVAPSGNVSMGQGLLAADKGTVNVQHGYAAAQELLHLSRDEGVIGQLQQTARMAVFSKDEILQGLNHVVDSSNEQVTRHDIGSMLGELQDTLLATTDGASKSIPVELRDPLELMEHLLTAMNKDPLIAGNMRGQLSKMELPLLKAVIQDDSLLKDKSHPLHSILNKSEHLAQVLGDSIKGRQIMQDLDEVFTVIAHSDTLDAPLLQNAKQTVDRIHEETLGRREQRLMEIAAQCDKEEELLHNRLAVLADIDELFNGQEVAVVILKLLDSGWKNLLINSYVYDGADSQAYGHYLELLQELCHRLNGEWHWEDVNDEALLDDLYTRIERVRSDQSTNTRVRALLAGELAKAAIEPMEIEKKVLPSLRAIAEKKWLRDSLSGKPAGIAAAEWEKWLNKTATLSPGDMVSFKDDKGRGGQEQLAWIARDNYRLVFLDQDGENIGHDLGLGKLAAMFAEGSAVLLLGWDLPLLDRAAYNMLESIHSQLLEKNRVDQTTGLLNRRSFEQKLGEALLDEERPYYVCYLDLDDFNIINTSCGHESGDALVASIGRLIRRELAECCCVARMGGDEFGILYQGMEQKKALHITERIRRAIANFHFECEGHKFNISASIGFMPIGVGDTLRSIFTDLDAAVIAAKEAGHNRIETYSIENASIKRRSAMLSWVGRFSKMFDNNLLQLKCQKILPLRHISARPNYEMLLKVMDEEGNTMPLDEFIAAAESYNRIRDIDRWVVNKVFEWMVGHRRSLNKVNGISINLSPHSIEDRAFILSIVERLKADEVPAHKLCFEITESANIDDLEQTITNMRMLKRMGCKLSIDGFGNRQASYQYIKQMPLDYLKIDGMFVRDIAVNNSDYAVAKSVCEMGHAMGKMVIAEYVENLMVRKKLEQIGVDYVQGFGIEKPIDLDKLFPSA